MHRSHSKLQRYAQYVGSVPLMPQSEKHSGFRPVHVAAALTACEARFLAASAGNTNHAVSIPVMARVTIRMISSQFQCYPSQHPRGAYASAGSSLVRLTLCSSSFMRWSSSVSGRRSSELAYMTTWAQWLPFSIAGLQRCLDVLVIPQCLANAWASQPALAMPKPHIRARTHCRAASPGDAFAALKTAKGWRADCETPAWPRTKRNSS
jgi:hypothetical protein